MKKDEASKSTNDGVLTPRCADGAANGGGGGGGADWAKSFGDAYNVIAVTAGLLMTSGISALFALQNSNGSGSGSGNGGESAGADGCLRAATLGWVVSLSFLVVPVTAIPAVQFFLVRALSFHQRQLASTNNSNNDNNDNNNNRKVASLTFYVVPPVPDGTLVKHGQLARFIDEAGPSCARHLSLLFFFLGAFAALLALFFSVQYKFTQCSFSVESAILLCAMVVLFIVLAIIYRSANNHLKYAICNCNCNCNNCF